MTKEVKLTTASKVLRHIATRIEADMKTHHSQKRRRRTPFGHTDTQQYPMRDGVCGYFSGMSWNRPRKELVAVDRARRLFSSLYRPPSAAFWFGAERTDSQQIHRITALLLTAAIAESNGD